MTISRHLTFWLLVVLILNFIFRNTFGSKLDAFYFISMLLPIIAGTYYFLNYQLIPRYLLKERYWRFALYFFYTVIVSLYLEMIIMTVALIFFADYNLGRMEPYASDVISLGTIMYMIVFAGLFISTIFKFRKQSLDVRKLTTEISLKERAFIEVKSNRKTVKIYHNEIRYIESLSDYVRFHLERDGISIDSRDKISHIEEKLPSVFIRCHRSFVVNKSQITSFNAEKIFLGDMEIPISRSFKKHFREAMNTT